MAAAPAVAEIEATLLGEEFKVYRISAGSLPAGDVSTSGRAALPELASADPSPNESD